MYVNYSVRVFIIKITVHEPQFFCHLQDENTSKLMLITQIHSLTHKHTVCVWYRFTINRGISYSKFRFFFFFVNCRCYIFRKGMMDNPPYQSQMTIKCNVCDIAIRARDIFFSLSHCCLASPVKLKIFIYIIHHKENSEPHS